MNRILGCWLMLLTLCLISPVRGETSPHCGEWSTFDAEGVAITDYGGQIGRQYNPTTISAIAFSCFARYKSQRLPEDWQAIIAQINWLRNNAIFIGEDFAAYNHAFPWSFGLKPGWRSGSAQADVILVMIIYYRESSDQSVLPLIRRLKNLMMLPVGEGGTLARTPEGGIWIEEFPSNPPSLVLGGFVDGIEALYEFTRLFPQDIQAQQDFESALASLKSSLRFYDSGTWMYIDRYPGRTTRVLAGDIYGIAYPDILQDLYEITADPFLLATSLRWRSFFENVHFRSDGNVRRDEHGIYRLTEGLPKRDVVDFLKDNFEIVGAPDTYTDYGPDKLFDDDIDTYLSAVPGPARIHLRLKKPQVINTLRLSLYNVGLYPTELTIQIKAEGEADFKSIRFKRESSRRYIYYRFNALRAEELRVIATGFSQQERLVVSGLALGNIEWEDRASPTYCNRTTPPVHLDEPAFRVQVDAPIESTKQIFIIYRHAADYSELESSPWEWDFIDPFAPRAIAAHKEIYQFRILCTLEAGKRGWKGFTVLNRDNETAYHE